MNGLTESQLHNLKQALLRDKQSLEQQLHSRDEHQLKVSHREAVGELSTLDNHPGDLASELYEREKDIALQEHLELHLEDIDRALASMETGTYGECPTCKRPIPYDRLEAYPTAVYCVAHTPDQHVSRRRPAEEAFLTPPFGRSSMDDHDEYNGFDGEDAWQIVESWGTSNSPAFAEQAETSDYDDLYVEQDEPDGYVQPIESFLATDLYGTSIQVVRNREYEKYMTSEIDEMVSNPVDMTDVYHS
ncbi:TraR/DksA C4-type zinc finger protein [Marinicrinis sediminis]|uniref:TraR/DksA C4-type zinc finger protein n=1 Tax=Marinicrinis sediminis TaxID=1652465 RepID=A0ABW5RBA3_9BACL